MKHIEIAKKQAAWAQHEIEQKLDSLSTTALKRIANITGMDHRKLVEIAEKKADIRGFEFWEVLLLAAALGIKSDKLIPAKPGLTPKTVKRKETGLV